AIGLVVPPQVSEIGRHHIRAGVDVTDDALARRNRARQLMFDRVPGLVLWDRRIDLRALSPVAKGGVGTGMHRRAVIRVNHVASCTTAVAIVTGMVVGAWQ